MMLALTYEGHPITVLANDVGEAEWIADEVCAVLGLAHKQALSRLDDDEKGVRNTDTPGGPQKKATINESGLYSLILRSRKPEAKAFKRWVTHEVLPQIRKTGTYTSKPPAKLDPAWFSEMARSNQDAIEGLRKRIAELESEGLSKRIAELECELENGLGYLTMQLRSLQALPAPGPVDGQRYILRRRSDGFTTTFRYCDLGGGRACWLLLADGSTIAYGSPYWEVVQPLDR